MCVYVLWGEQVKSLILFWTFFNPSVQLDKDCNQVSRKLWSTLSLLFMSPAVPPALVQHGHGSAPLFLPTQHCGREERTHSRPGDISHFPNLAVTLTTRPWLPWEGRSHPVPALTPCKYTHTLTSKAHTISLSLQGVQGNPLQLLKDWKHKKGFYKSFNHRTAIAWLGLPCRVKAMGDTWPECLYVCPRAVARDFKGIRNASEGCMCHFKYVHVSGLSSSFPEGSVWKSICFIFRLCLWVFLSPGEAVGGLCHSLSALFCL